MILSEIRIDGQGICKAREDCENIEMNDNNLYCFCVNMSKSSFFENKSDESTELINLFGKINFLHTFVDFC